MGRHFVSYSRGDGKPFALRLCERLEASPDIRLWVDGRDMPRSVQYGGQVLEAIAECDSFLFVWTRGSARSVDCRRELAFADEYLKPMIVLEVHRRQWNLDGRRGDMDMYEIGGWPTVDFTDDNLEPGLAVLRNELDHLRSPGGRLLMLNRQRDRVVRAIEAAESEAEQQRAEVKLLEVDQEISEAEEMREPERRTSAGDDHGLRGRGPRSVDSGSRRARAVDPPTGSLVRCINPLPRVPEDPWQFQDRALQTQQLAQCLDDELANPVIVRGGDGLGKTAMVTRLLRDLASGVAPPFERLVYLSAEGTRPVNAAVLLEDLCLAFLDGDSPACTSLVSRSDLRHREKLEQLLRRRPSDQRVLLILDSFELLLDGQRFRDGEMRGLLDRLLAPHLTEGIKLLLVSREVPDDLLRDVEPYAKRISLDEGLPVPDAKAVLQRLDSQRPHRLPDQSDPLLDEACRLTGGHPRALEALYGVLRDDERLSLEQLVERMRQRSPGGVVDYLIVERFNRLRWPNQRVVQALAVYEQPVEPAAVDYLLEPYAPGELSEYALARMKNQGLVRQDGPRYYLPLDDRGLVLRRVESGDPVDRHRARPPFTMLALLHRAADYFVQLRSDDATDVDQLLPQLREADLRIRGQEFEAAFDLVQNLDEAYLDRWGRSGELARYREALVGKLEGQADELVNLAALGDSAQHRGLPAEAITHYRGALDLVHQLRDRINPVTEADLRISLGSAFYWDGQLDEAIRSYEHALVVAEEHLRRESQAAALSGLSICQAERGQLTRAVERAKQGLEIACEEGMHELEAEILLNVGVWHGQLGQTHRAMDSLGEALALARRHGRRLVEAKALSAAAEVLVDQGRLARAIALADEAIAVGERLENPDVVPGLLATRGLAQLLAGALDPAWESVKQAYDLRRPGHTLTAPLLYGIVALRRLGDDSMAEGAFLDAHAEAVSLQGKIGRRVEYLDAEGIACCGLAIVSEGQERRLGRAVRAFRAARSITTAPGIVDRTVRLLGELVDPWSTRLLDRARQAATRRRSLRHCSSLDQVAGSSRGTRAMRRR
jgi:tetratricopeptide (TPR) repeat protein